MIVVRIEEECTHCGTEELGCNVDGYFTPRKAPKNGLDESYLKRRMALRWKVGSLC